MIAPLARYQARSLKTQTLNARAAIKEAAVTVDHHGRKKADREKALRLLNSALVSLTNLEHEIDELTEVVA